MNSSTKTSEQLDDVALSNFLTYLRFKTVHPDPNYIEAVDWLCAEGKMLGLDCMLTEIIVGNPILVMRWTGRDPSLPAILLNSHVDVVPVVEKEWEYPPFDAQMSADGKIYARGTQDMKSVGIQQLEAVRRLKSRGVEQLRRTVYLSFVPDEELGGIKGMLPFVQGQSPPSHLPHQIQFTDMRIGLCLDEGLPNPTDDYVAYYDERQAFWFVAHFYGVAGHGLTLLDGTAGEKLSSFLQRIYSFRSNEKAKLESGGQDMTIGDVTSVNCTILNGGTQINVLPSKLSVWIDSRLSSSMPVAKWKAQLNQWAEEVGGGIEFEFSNNHIVDWESATNPNISPSKSWTTLINVCRSYGIEVKKKVFPGGTDSRYVRHYHKLSSNPYTTKRIEAIGFSPIRRTPCLLHAHNEYLSKEEFLRGCKVYTDLVYELGELKE